jgi:hypothetical protein
MQWKLWNKDNQVSLFHRCHHSKWTQFLEKQFWSKSGVLTSQAVPISLVSLQFLKKNSMLLYWIVVERFNYLICHHFTLRYNSYKKQQKRSNEVIRIVKGEASDTTQTADMFTNWAKISKAAYLKCSTRFDILSPLESWEPFSLSWVKKMGSTVISTQTLLPVNCFTPLFQWVPSFI